jgi:hypothetical protein
MNRMRTIYFPSVPFASQPRRRALPCFMVALVLCALVGLASGVALGQWPAPRTAASAPASSTASSANAARPAAATAQKLAPTASGGKGTHEGIVVHGYWKIDIRNPDGTLVRHAEFENSLAGGTGLQINQSGGALLASLLEGSVGSNTPLFGEYSQGLSILVSGADYGPAGFQTMGGLAPTPQLTELGPGPCNTFPGAGGSGTSCILTSTSNPLYDNCLFAYVPNTCASGLTTTANFSNNSNGQLVGFASLTLNGSITAGENSTILSVATLVTTCTSQSLSTCAVPATPGPISIPNAVVSLLTYYAIPVQTGATSPGIPIDAGQTAAISVSLSFQ